MQIGVMSHNLCLLYATSMICATVATVLQCYSSILFHFTTRLHLYIYIIYYINIKFLFRFCIA